LYKFNPLNTCLNVSTTPLLQWGFRQCLPFSWTTLTGEHCRHAIAVMRVVDTVPRNVIFSCQLCINQCLISCSNMIWTFRIFFTFLFALCVKYGTSGYGVSRPGIQNKKGFCIKINLPKGNYWILKIGLMGSLSSLQKSEFLKLIISFFHYFWCQNWDLSHKMSGKKTHIYFLYFQFKNKRVWVKKNNFLCEFDFYAKTFLILYPWSWNSITGNAIVSRLTWIKFMPKKGPQK
jgi:hypothetical protein